jgi:hypothetical protein
MSRSGGLEKRMGKLKDRLIEREEQWERIAAERGYRCVGCGTVLTNDEYDMYISACNGCAPSLGKA